MKCSEQWLREWVNPPLTREDLCHTLVMAGLEVEELNQIEDDYTFDLSITPNRGDCLSVRGLAREIAALTNSPIKYLPITTISPAIEDQLSITMHEEKACPVYMGRIIRHLRSDSTTPVWLKERLNRSDIPSIHPVVDIVNYVMLELGQPMHAFDLSTLDQSIHIRYAKETEKILLLDQNEYDLHPETLIIADQTKPLAIAGVMGGLDSSVTLSTQDIFLESAYFLPEEVAKARQYYFLNSDSAYRFERGIDPTMQREAIERVSQLILEIIGGEAGPIIEKRIKNTDTARFIHPKKIELHQTKIEKILGFTISKKEIEDIFTSLQFTYEYCNSPEKNQIWMVNIPAYRNDLSVPEDLIEEIARLYGYDRIPVSSLQAELKIHSPNELMDQIDQLKLAFMHQGFHEIISYSFVDKQWQALLDPNHPPKNLLNPITADMSVMRTNLWPGLIKAMSYNQSRQQNRICLFEIGTCFLVRDQELFQETKLAGLLTGLSNPLQWGKPTKEVDFFDLKGKIEDILNNFKLNKTLLFKPEKHPALHPGQTAGIYLDDQRCGIIGALHPEVIKALDISDKTGKIFLFELNLPLPKAGQFDYHEISKFPEIRRDLAIIVNETIPVKEIQDTIKKVVGSWLREVFVFDVYQGKGISPGLKSVALALILQHPTRTLVDGEVADLMERAIVALQDQLGAALRS